MMIVRGAMMKKVLLASLALLLLAFFALPAMASLQSDNTLVYQLGSSYYFTDLSYGGNAHRLFQPPSNDPIGQPPQDTPPDLWWNNNRSPLAGDGFPNYVPSPGGSAAGEGFDIEGVFWRYVGGVNNELRVWVVTSVQPYDTSQSLDGADYTIDHTTYHYALGDVFINRDYGSTGGSTGTLVGGYDYALLSFDQDHPNESYTPGWSGDDRHAGDLVSLSSDDTLFGINGPYSYAGASHTPIPGLTYPWAVNAEGNDPGAALVDGTHNLLYQEVNTDLVQQLDDYGSGQTLSDTNNLPTYIYFFDVFVDVDLTQYLDYLSDPGAWHVTVQCGNDLSNGSGGPGGADGQVPVPGALILGIIGAGLIGLRRRMKG
jgi:hypothetical protein